MLEKSLRHTSLTSLPLECSNNLSQSSDNNELMQAGVLVIGSNAGPGNPIVDGQLCFNISLDDDDIKEGVETFTLNLQTDDDCVWLGRDRAVVSVQANGGKSANQNKAALHCTQFPVGMYTCIIIV